MTNPLPDTAITDEQVDRRNLIASVIARHFNDDRPTGTLPADEKLADTICAALNAAAQVGKEQNDGAIPSTMARSRHPGSLADLANASMTAGPALTTPGRVDDGWQLVPKKLNGQMLTRLGNGIKANFWHPADCIQAVWDGVLSVSTPPPIQCTCGQSGHGNAHEPGCPMSDYRPVQSARQERLAESGEQDNELIAQLRHPIGYGGVNSEDAYEKFDELRLKAADRLEKAEAELAEAEKVIEPFVVSSLLEGIDEMPDDYGFVDWLNMTGRSSPTIGDLRAAREWRERNHKQEGV